MASPIRATFPGSLGHELAARLDLPVGASNVDDLVRAADHLLPRFAAPAILIGHSLCGAAVLAVVNETCRRSAAV